MPSENLNIDEITEARRKAIAETIHPIDVEAVRALADQLFPSTDHPWRDKLLTFVVENADATFHHAMTHERAHIIYCRAKDKGFWFVPGGGVGLLQARGLGILKEIVETLH